MRRPAALFVLVRDGPVGVYPFERPGEGSLLIPVADPTGVRMWGSA